MTKASFQINNKLQDCEVQIENIIAKGGQLAPELCIPLTIQLYKSNTNQYPETFTLNFIEANLRFQNLDFEASRIVKPLTMNSGGFTRQTLTLEFRLSDAIVQAIEKTRTTDVHIVLSLTFHYGVYIKLPLNNLPDIKQTIHGELFQKSEFTQCSITMVIPHSQWLSKVLPGLGYQACKLIELPLGSDLLGDIFPKSVVELETALEYFKKGDYDKAIGHCRVALEPIKKKIPVIKSAVESNSEFDWIKKSLDSTLTCLETITKETYGLSSKTHHPPSIGHFNRKTTEAIILMTTSIIAFVGQIDSPV